jgi:hypothetical protein
MLHIQTCADVPSVQPSITARASRVEQLHANLWTAIVHRATIDMLMLVITTPGLCLRLRRCMDALDRHRPPQRQEGLRLVEVVRPVEATTIQGMQTLAGRAYLLPAQAMPCPRRLQLCPDERAHIMNTITAAGTMKTTVALRSPVRLKR